MCILRSNALSNPTSNAIPTAHSVNGVKSALALFMSIFMLSGLFMQGCGFQLRGQFFIPTALKILKITPNQPSDPFHRALKSILKSNGVQIIDSDHQAPGGYSMLTIVNQTLSDRTIAYGSDGQPNRSILELKIQYEVTDITGKLIVSGTAQVDRELIITPNAILGTENQRTRILSDLSLDAASQVARQLSATATRASS